MTSHWYRNGFFYLLVLVALVALLNGLFGVNDGMSGRATGTAVQIGWLEGCVAVLLGAFAAAAAHELGHVVLGLLAGFRPVTVPVWPVEVIRTRQRVRLRRANLLTSGLTSMLAAETDLRRKAVFLCAGGPLASLLAAGGGLWLCFGPGARASGLSWATVFPGSMGIFAAVTLALSAVDLGPRGLLANDGTRVRRFSRSEEEAQRWCAVSALQAAAMHGLRPRDWDAELIARATSLPDGSYYDAAGCLVAYRWALDRGDLARATDFLGRALSAAGSLSSLSRQEFLLEGAYFEACYGAGLDRARALYGEASRISYWITEPHVDLRAEAAVLLAEGNCAEATDRARRGLAAAARARSEGAAQAEREWLERILMAAQLRMENGTSGA